MPDSATIDNAVLTKLSADATLLALCPNGVYFDEAPGGMTQFVIVSLVDEADVQQVGGRSYEDALFQVEARLQSKMANANANCRAAAARIDVLLEDATITAAGYSWMRLHRESRIRLIEVDEVDSSIRWYRRGGNYRVQMSL